MLDVIKFILKTIADFINMLFEIDLGFTSLGALMCLITFFLPIILLFVNMLKIKMKGD